MAEGTSLGEQDSDGAIVGEFEGTDDGFGLGEFVGILLGDCDPEG